MCGPGWNHVRPCRLFAHQLKLFSGHQIVAVPAMSFFSRVRDFGPLKFLMSKTVTAGATQRVQQEQLDLYRAAVLLRGHDWFVQNSAKEGGSQISVQPTEADIERFYHDIDQLRPKAVQSLVQKSVDLQLRNMFSKLDDYATAIGKMKERRHHSQPIEPFTTLRESLGFELKCKTSSIPNAGLGVFVEGAVVPGTVIALIPGVVHLSEYANQKDYIKNLLPDDDFNLLMRFDGHIIDSRRVDETPSNPYALGHKVNHVPISYQPNCIQIPFNFPADPLGIDEFPEDFKKYVPYKFNAERSILGTPDRSSFMYGMVLIAAKPLGDDDELYVDYRLNPAAELPTWYRTFDKAGAERRWVDDNPTMGSVFVKQVAEKAPFIKHKE